MHYLYSKGYKKREKEFSKVGLHELKAFQETSVLVKCHYFFTVHSGHCSTSCGSILCGILKMQLLKSDFSNIVNLSQFYTVHSLLKSHCKKAAAVTVFTDQLLRIEVQQFPFFKREKQNQAGFEPGPPTCQANVLIKLDYYCW